MTWLWYILASFYDRGCPVILIRRYHRIPASYELYGNILPPDDKIKTINFGRHERNYFHIEYLTFINILFPNLVKGVPNEHDLNFLTHNFGSWEKRCLLVAQEQSFYFCIYTTTLGSQQDVTSNNNHSCIKVTLKTSSGNCFWDCFCLELAIL